MMHDCAITEHYMLLLDVPLELDPQVAARGGGVACGGMLHTNQQAWHGMARHLLLAHLPADHAVRNAPAMLSQAVPCCAVPCCAGHDQGGQAAVW